MTVITTDGTTLLGADDKAGVAEIVEAMWRLKENPNRCTGRSASPFTTDEEVGRGTEHFDVKRSAPTTPTRSTAPSRAEIEDETFCADWQLRPILLLS